MAILPRIVARHGNCVRKRSVFVAVKHAPGAELPTPESSRSSRSWRCFGSCPRNRSQGRKPSCPFPNCSRACRRQRNLCRCWSRCRSKEEPRRCRSARVVHQRRTAISAPTYQPAQLYGATAGALRMGALVGMSAAKAACAQPRLNTTANRLAILVRIAPASKIKTSYRIILIPGPVAARLAIIEQFSAGFAQNRGLCCVSATAFGAIRRSG